MTVPGILSDFDDDVINLRNVTSGRRIIVANQLPLKARFESGKWVFEFDPDSLVLQLKSGLKPGTECVYVGSLSVDIDPTDQDEVAQI
ncbi:hypothetical protein Tco_0205631, partial [Tanacetum coccineum]